MDPDFFSMTKICDLDLPSKHPFRITTLPHALSTFTSGLNGRRLVTSSSVSNSMNRVALSLIGGEIHLMDGTNLPPIKAVRQRSGCGSVGRVVTSNSRGRQFKSFISKFYIEHLLTCLLSTVLKRRKQIKRGRKWPTFKKRILTEFPQRQ